MDPRLAAVAGPREGALIALPGETRISVGRDAANDVCLKSMCVSRRHCVIERQGSRVIVADLGSHNGTFVNGVPVKERDLLHGDQVRVGDSVFLVLLEENETPPGAPVQLIEKGIEAGSTLELSSAESVPGAAASSADGRAARDLEALLDLSGTIQAFRDVQALQRGLLESVFRVVPAERGAVLLAGREGEIESVFGLESTGEPGRGVTVSRTIALRVLREGVSVLCNDVRQSADFGSSESLAGANVLSVLAVPLSAGERPIGVLYLDSSRKESRFDRGHLELLSAVAGIASIALENARRFEWLEGENRRLGREAELAHDMVGEGPAMGAVLRFVGKVAPTDSTVLITGESGTGKELVARALHRNSPRAARAFVAVNCAALAENLLESEMFGHERGAFTGAVLQKKGKIETADGGTLFLDEVGELAPALQAKLLRVLQEHTFERVGGTRPIKVDVRVVTATNRDLKEMTKTGGFREDLFYRINVVALRVPPLRERVEDIPLLARYFALKYGERCNRRLNGISDEALDCLTRYDWPGNVRELENALERAVVLGSGDTIRPEDLPDDVVAAGPPVASATRYHEAVLATKKQVIMKAFRESGGNYAETARLLDVHPNYLHRLVRNMDLKGMLKKT